MLHKSEPGMDFTGGYTGVPNATAAQSGTAVSMAKYNNFALKCQLKAHASNGIGATFYIAEGTNSTQFSSSYIATVTLASNTETDQEDVIEVKASQLSSGYSYVKGVIVCAATSTVQAVAVANMRFNPRFA